MSDFGVYDDEMLNNRFSDQDVERLLSDKTPEDEDLAGLAPILERLHGGAQRPLLEERIARFAAQAAKIATSTKPEPAGTAVPERTTTRPRRFVLALRQKMATGLAAALLLSGMTGVAVASNGAAPGDPLYGLDRALEAVGIADGGAAERIAEAQSLFNEGQVAEAVAHSAEAVEVELEAESEVENIEVLTSEEAIEALEAVVEKLTTDGNDANDHAATVVSNVAALLDYMATTTETGKDFGQGVAALARQISGESNEAADNGTDNADTAAVGADNAENAAEESEDAPPEDVPAGPPDSVPPSDTTDRP